MAKQWTRSLVMDRASLVCSARGKAHVSARYCIGSANGTIVKCEDGTVDRRAWPVRRKSVLAGGGRPSNLRGPPFHAPSEGRIPMEAARAILETDQQHLIHPLHHVKDHEQPILFVEGRNEMLIDADGKQYIDGLSSLWNVNAGHGRKELVEAAAEQVAKLDVPWVYAV